MEASVRKHELGQNKIVLLSSRVRDFMLEGMGG